MSYKGPEHKHKVVLVVVPSRELNHDLSPFVINTGVFNDTEVSVRAASAWNGRWPLG